MNFKDELLSLFPAIDVIPYTYSLYPFTRNNRTYKVLMFYRVRIKCGEEILLLWIYVTKTKYIISYGYTLQTIILDKKEKYKVFQVISCFTHIPPNEDKWILKKKLNHDFQI